MLSGLQFEAVVHFAGLMAVADSIRDPLHYYQTNLRSTLNLLTAMDAVNARTLVFSSSATVYGPAPEVPSHEGLAVSATNPYGWTKVIGERMLRDLAAADSRWAVACLRYFNPVGAHPSGLIGENPAQPPTNLMPIVAQVAAGARPHLSVYGGDYPTVDGTCVRDFIHVDDLATGHISAPDALRQGPGLRTWNLGTGRGTSVLELVHAFERASGRPVPYEIGARRPGDVAVSYADPSAAHRDLGWRATRTLDDMCADTWRWPQASHRLAASTRTPPLTDTLTRRDPRRHPAGVEGVGGALTTDCVHQGARRRHAGTLRGE